GLVPATGTAWRRRHGPGVQGPTSSPGPGGGTEAYPQRTANEPEHGGALSPGDPGRGPAVASQYRAGLRRRHGRWRLLLHDGIRGGHNAEPAGAYLGPTAGHAGLRVCPAAGGGLAAGPRARPGAPA